MYNCSDAFHEAIQDGEEQKALLIFPDCVFTDTDIDVTGGITFRDYFCADEDIAIGQANSNEISFSLFNDDRLLNDYAFGEFLATMGVLIGTETYITAGISKVVTKYASYVGEASYPYIRRNNAVIPVQPSFPVKSILAYDDKVWCFGEDGKCAVYNDRTAENITSKNKPNDYMKAKSQEWEGKGIYYNKETRMLFIYENGERKQYEFCPLGWFIAERPKAPDVIKIDMTCYDFMQKFDVDMPKPSEMGVTYPVTVANLLKKMCEYVGVQYKSGAFINSTAVIQKEPADFRNVTMREVLKYIAEMSGSNARFNRDGVLELAWLRETAQTYEMKDYEQFSAHWYETRKVTKLYNRDTQNSNENTYGTGKEGYLIQDNPLLRGVS